MKHTVYVGVRKDLPLEHQMVQASHAALEAGFAFASPPEVAHLVLLEMEGPKDLEKWIVRMEEHGIDHRVFFEPDNQFGHTAFATRPLRCEEKKIFRKAKLLRHR